jgi:hypothetical protein
MSIVLHLADQLSLWLGSVHPSLLTRQTTTQVCLQRVTRPAGQDTLQGPVPLPCSTVDLSRAMDPNWNLKKGIEKEREVGGEA